MVYGYARVSTDKQDADRQELDILRYAEAQDLGQVKMVRETISSRKAERQVYAVIETMEAGDVLLVTELSRLARSMIELNGIISSILLKGASLRVTDGQQVNESIGSQSLVFAMGIAAQVERSMISERTKSALRARKEQGVKLGRPAGVSKLDDMADDIFKYKGLGVNHADIARILGISRSTLNLWLTKRGQA